MGNLISACQSNSNVQPDLNTSENSNNIMYSNLKSKQRPQNETIYSQDSPIRPKNTNFAVPMRSDVLHSASQENYQPQSKQKYTHYENKKIDGQKPITHIYTTQEAEIDVSRAEELMNLKVRGVGSTKNRAAPVKISFDSDSNRNSDSNRPPPTTKITFADKRDEQKYHIQKKSQDFNTTLRKVNIELKESIQPGTKEVVRQLYEDGSLYEGEKSNGKRCGFGKFVYSSGGMYQGEWNAGKISGYGILLYPSNTKAYEGYWEDNQFNGYGCVYNQFPQESNHLFNHFNFETLGEYWTQYEGEFKNDLKHGQGVLHLVNGQKFIGSFVEDCLEGQGEYIFADGGVLKGEWRNNKFINID